MKAGEVALHGAKVDIMNTGGMASRAAGGQEGRVIAAAILSLPCGGGARGLADKGDGERPLLDGKRGLLDGEVLHFTSRRAPSTSWKARPT